jgi:anti-sigma regulatory factor (Ser/Thr protein kinase)
VGVLAVNHEPASAATVRHSIADDLASRDIDPQCVDDVVLVAGELVGNAVVHADSRRGHDLDVSWDIQADAVVVRVLDDSPDLPRRRASTERVGGGGGLAIVAAIALDWGVRRTDKGKLVWARVPITPV